MLSLGSYRVRDCQGVSRRSFLKASAALPFAAGLAGVDPRVLAAEAPKAKSVMLVWLIGGPSHLDLFDPKPRAPDLYRGPFSAIATRTPGLQVTELLPRLANSSHRFSVVRSNINYHGGHREAGSIGMTGYLAPDGGEGGQGSPASYQPHFGSILARHRSRNRLKADSIDLPGFVSLARGPIGDGVGPNFGYGGGTWGKGHDPFMFSCSENGKVSIPELKLLDGLTQDRLANRREVLSKLDALRRRADQTDFTKWDAVYRRAFNLISSIDANRVFDLTKENDRTRDAYGHTSFGQSALLGRRLVEAGVPFVQVNWSQFVEVLFPNRDYGWDTHSDNFGLMADWHGPLLDRTLSVLLEDLDQRGLLETTLVCCMGEFGRTPRINSIGSRDHWHQCYFSVWAGGGIEPGRVIGQSDKNGELPATDPVTPAMVGSTMLELAGVTSATRVQLQVLQDGARVIDGLV
ncbi:MAG: hypothetical protein CMJ65_16045 [Planctomycetaceae bacterium]|nr:hypothetical protein [Planctomycetaceae bacterium]